MADFHIEKWREDHAPNAAMLRHILVSQGYCVFQWSDLPETIYVLHLDSKDQLYWIISGSLEIMIDGISYVLETGERGLLPAETWHSARVVGEETVVYLIGEKTE